MPPAKQGGLRQWRPAQLPDQSSMVSRSCVGPVHMVEGIGAQARAFLSRTTTMRVGSFRFTPPPLVLSPEMRWLLLRSFGPPGRAFEGAVDPQAVLRLAAIYTLAARVCARNPAGNLIRELGEDVAGGFFARHRRTAANDLLMEYVAREVARAGEAIRVPVILLKYASLRFGGIVAFGARGAADLDALVPAEQQSALRRHLLQEGFESTHSSRQDHHLVPLMHHSGVALELHTEIPGLRLSNGRSLATVKELMDKDLCKRVPALPEGCYVLTREVMLAHVLVHGLAQHGLSPETYPLMRMLADLLDLDFGTASLQEFLAGPYRWISDYVSDAEIGAVADLCDWLVTDQRAYPNGTAEPTQPWKLLSHIIAGPVDPQYRQVLRLKGASVLLGLGGKSVIRRATPLFHALVLTREQIDMIYGRPSGWIGYLGWRLWRPVDLAIRLFRYGRAYLAVRARRNVRSSRRGAAERLG